jgi:4'-phosphopantetheinyl transferase EntD
MRDWMQWPGERRCGLRALMSELADRLRAILSPSVALGWADPDDPTLDAALENLPQASLQRRQEFQAGRQAARWAMAQLGLPARPIPMANDRSPEWPDGLVGSISHCRGACFAIVAQSAQFRGLGIDIEPLADLPQDIWDTVLRAEELQSIQRLPSDTWGRAALQHFVAKEAVYKAQFPISKRLIDFHAIRLTMAFDHLSAEFMIDIPSFVAGSKLQGKLVQTEAFVASVVTIERT